MKKCIYKGTLRIRLRKYLHYLTANPMYYMKHLTLQELKIQDLIYHDFLMYL